MTEGLPGPPVDTGEDPITRRTILPRWVKPMAAAALILAAASIAMAAGLYMKVNHLSHERDKRQGKATEAALFALGYRVCQRESVDRGYARLRDPSGTKGRLVLIDCLPNLREQPARPMTPEQARAFVQKIRERRLTLVEQGLCPLKIRVEDLHPAKCKR